MNHSPQTDQENFWATDFGSAYLERNRYQEPEALDQFYHGLYGVTRTAMNQTFLSGLDLERVLEVGCNIGNQLSLLRAGGQTGLYGIDISSEAIAVARQALPEANVLQGSALDLPFKDGFFDLVFTSGVLIHIHPNDLQGVLREVYRSSRRYIWGFEYFNEGHTAIPYRGHSDRLWKGDFAQLYQDAFPDLRLVKEVRYPYLENENVDTMYLLEKA